MALTDGTGKLAAHYEYDAWGNVMTEAEKTGVDNPYRYSTKEWDEKSGLYYFGAGYHAPEIRSRVSGSCRGACAEKGRCGANIVRVVWLG